MVAAPFTGTMEFFAQQSKRTFQRTFTASDVVAESYIWQDGDDTLNLPSGEGGLLITDLILSAAGTDTTTASIFANQQNTPDIVQNAANLATNVSRQFMGAPIGFKPGARVRMKQVA